MKGIYKIYINNETKEYNNYWDIPEKFDNLVSFSPEYPQSPHSEEDHKLIDSFQERFLELMERENASSN